jgi:hypothetical protein
MHDEIFIHQKYLKEDDKNDLTKKMFQDSFAQKKYDFQS